MRAIRTLVIACLVTMTAALAWGFTAGDFWSEGEALVRMPWGVITIIDVYTGAALFAGWIAFRERSVPIVAAWVILIVLLGNLATSLYALLAVARSGGDVQQFWMGAGRR